VSILLNTFHVSGMTHSIRIEEFYSKRPTPAARRLQLIVTNKAREFMKKLMPLLFMLIPMVASAQQPGQPPQQEEKSSDNSTCYDCEARSSQQWEAMFSAPLLNTIFWAALKSPNEPQKACVSDLEKGSISTFDFSHENAAYMCKHRKKKDIAQASSMSLDSKKYYRDYTNYLATAQAVTGIPAVLLVRPAGSGN
jgi:hypothetical protein